MLFICRLLRPRFINIFSDRRFLPDGVFPLWGEPLPTMTRRRASLPGRGTTDGSLP